VTSPGGSLGEASLIISADASRFTEELQREVLAAVERIAQKIEARLRRALKAEVKLSLGADEISRIKAQIAAINATISLKLKLAAGEISRLRATLAALNVGRSIPISLTLAPGTIGALRARIAAINVTLTVPVRLNMQGLTARLNALTRDREIEITLRLVGEQEVIRDLERIEALLIRIRGLTLIRIRQPGGGGGGGGNPFGNGSIFSIRNLALLAAILGPALAALGGGAAALAGGLAALGVAGGLALFGIKRAMDAGTQAGKTFQARLSVLQGTFNGVADIAARMSETQLAGALREANVQLLALTPTIATLAGIFGRTVQNLVPGLIGGFNTFEPVLVKVGLAAEGAAKRFSNWATGPGGAVFARSLSEAFDQAAPIVGSFGQAVSAVVAALFRLNTAFGPVLTATFNVIAAVANEVNEIFQLSFVQDIFQLIARAAGRLQDILVPLIHSFGDLVAEAEFLEPLFRVGLVVVFGALYAVAGLLNGAMKILTNVFKIIGPPIQLLVDIVEFLVRGFGALVGSPIASFFKGLGDVVKTILGPFIALRDALGSVFTAASEGIQSAMGKFKETSDDLVSGAVTSIEKLSGALTPAQEAILTATERMARFNLVTNRLAIPEERLKTFNKILGHTREAIESGGVTAEQAAKQLESLNRTFLRGSPAVAQLTDALITFADSEDRASDRGDLLVSVLTAMRGNMLTTAGSVLNAQVAVLNVAEALHDLGGNGRQAFQSLIDIGQGTGELSKLDAAVVPKVLALQQALIGQSDAGIAAAKQLYEVNLQTKGAEGATKIAGTALTNLKNLLVTQVAPAFRGNRAEAEKYLEKLGLIPPDVNTLVKLFGTESAEEILSDIRDLLSIIARGTGWTAKVEVPGLPGKATQAAKLKQELDQIARDRQANINITVSGPGANLITNPRSQAGGLTAFEYGGVIAKPTVSLMGEQYRKELVLPFEGHPAHAEALLAKHAPWLAQRVVDKFAPPPAPAASVSTTTSNTAVTNTSRSVTVHAPVTLQTPATDPHIVAKIVERDILAQIRG
jgi:hypothetical protein